MVMPEGCGHHWLFYGADGLRCQTCGAQVPIEAGEVRFAEDFDDSPEFGPVHIADAQPMTDEHLMPRAMRMRPR